MSRVMYIDAFAGAAGDMILGAFVDAGLPVDALREALGSLGVGHELRVEIVDRSGLRATRVEVGDPRDHHQHGHTHPRGEGHAHGHAPGHAHHSLAQISAFIEQSALSGPARARAHEIFRRIAEAEAAIHQMPLEEVHLHEVGALDSIIDIVGAAFAFEWWGVDDVVVSPLNVGRGTIEIAHGRFPVPAPATVRLVGQAPIFSAGPDTELLTPTGAAVLTVYATSFGRMPAMTVEHTGYGAGTKTFDKFPNVLRVFVGERAGEAEQTTANRVLRVECEIDDMTPQFFGVAAERLLAAGALDVFLTPVQMKRGRPGTRLTVLAPIDLRERLLDVIFRETTTIGVRLDEVEREILERRWDDVAVAGQPIRIKVAERRGRVVNAMPEFEDCVRAAAALNEPVKAVHACALQEWHAQIRARHG